MMRNIFKKGSRKADARSVQEGFLLIESLSAFLILTCAMLLAAHLYCLSIREYACAAERLRLLARAQQRSEKAWLKEGSQQENDEDVVRLTPIKGGLSLPDLPKCKRIWIEAHSERDPKLTVLLAAGIKEVG